MGTDGDGAARRSDPMDPATDAASSTDHGIRAIKLSMAGLAVTAGLQAAIVIASGSVALLADTIHNFADALTAVPLWIAFRLGLRPPDRRFPYGYHRAEDVAGMFIVGVIAASAGVATWEAVDHLVRPTSVSHAGWVLGAGIVGFLGNEIVAGYRIRTGRRMGSAALVADGQHARIDGLASLGVVGSAAAVMAGLGRADPIVGLAIAVAILFVLKDAAARVLHRLLDGTDESTVILLEEIAAAVPGVEHVTLARARWAGHGLNSEIHIDVDPSLSVQQGHAIAEHVEHTLLHAVPRLRMATVHVDPHDHDPDAHHHTVHHRDR